MRLLPVLAALSGAIAIAAGAFGAHAVTGQPAEWLRTGGQYQLIHAVAALVAMSHSRAAAWAMIGGAAVFAFSLYAMALGAPRWFGAITPLGGVAMIAGWICLAMMLGRRAA